MQRDVALVSLVVDIEPRSGTQVLESNLPQPGLAGDVAFWRFFAVSSVVENV
jgi:hypothetical protein